MANEKEEPKPLPVGEEKKCTCNKQVNGEPLIGGYARCSVHDPNSQNSFMDYGDLIATTNTPPVKQETEDELWEDFFGGIIKSNSFSIVIPYLKSKFTITRK